MIPEEASMLIRYQINQGVSKTSVAEQLGISRQTVYNHLIPKTKSERRARVSKLEPYKGYIQTRLDKYDLSARQIYHEITKQGYNGGYSLVKSFVRPLKASYLNKLTERFETLPGQQAQLDWGECGSIEYEGQRKKLYVFTFVLGYSRALSCSSDSEFTAQDSLAMMYAKFTTSIKQPVLLACMQEAFEILGIPQEVLVDNMKQIVDRHLPGEDAIFNKAFLDFAQHYGFMPIAAPPYWARVKGKVESGVKYVKYSFLKGREFGDLDDLNGQLEQWLNQAASLRVHGTTHQVPLERYQVEMGILRPFGAIPHYDTCPLELRKVAHDSHISFEGVRYSVNPKAVGKMVRVKSIGKNLLIYQESELVGEHLRAAKGSMDVTSEEHHLEIRRLNRSRPRTQRPRQPRFEQIPPENIKGFLLPSITVEMPALSLYDQFLGGGQ